MGELFQKLLDNLHRLWPVRIVDVDQQGVRRDRGKRATLLHPGIHWFFPGLQDIDTFYVSYQEVDCNVQSMETKDGVSVSFSINIGFVVSDASLVATKFYNFDSTLRNMARGRMATAVHERTFAELQGNLADVVSEMRRDLRRAVHGRGVRIKSVRLDEFARSRQFRLMGGMQTG